MGACSDLIVWVANDFLLSLKMPRRCRQTKKQQTTIAMPSAVPPMVMPIITPTLMVSRLTTAAADAVGELEEKDIQGTAFSGGAVAEGVMLEDGSSSSSSSQPRGEVEDGIVDGIEESLSGTLEHEGVVERVSSRSDEVWACVNPDEYLGSHSGYSDAPVSLFLYLEAHQWREHIFSSHAQGRNWDAQKFVNRKPQTRNVVMCDAKTMLAPLQTSLPPQWNECPESTIRKGRSFPYSLAVHLNGELRMLLADISEDRNGVSCKHPTITCVSL